MKKFTLATNYIMLPTLEAYVCLKPSDSEISDYIASFFTFPNEQSALDEIPDLIISQTTMLFEKFQAMENIDISIRNNYYI